MKTSICTSLADRPNIGKELMDQKLVDHSISFDTLKSDVFVFEMLQGSRAIVNLASLRMAYALKGSLMQERDSRRTQCYLLARLDRQFESLQNIKPHEIMKAKTRIRSEFQSQTGKSPGEISKMIAVGQLFLHEQRYYFEVPIDDVLYEISTLQEGRFNARFREISQSLTISLSSQEIGQSVNFLPSELEQKISRNEVLSETERTLLLELGLDKKWVENIVAARTTTIDLRAKGIREDVRKATQVIKGKKLWGSGVPDGSPFPGGKDHKQKDKGRGDADLLMLIQCIRTCIDIITNKAELNNLLGSSLASLMKIHVTASRSYEWE